MINLKLFNGLNKTSIKNNLYISNIKFFNYFCCIFCIFLIYHTNISKAFESKKTLDFSGNAPLFLSKKQIQEDLSQVKIILQENYPLYPVLENSGINWESKILKLGDRLSEKNSPTLTHHFQQELVRALHFTEDSNLRTDLFLKKRHYVKRVEPKVAFYSGIRLSKQQGRFRVLPASGFAKKITNYWFINCSSKNDMLFPILPERHSEELFMLGGHSNHQLKPLNCKFKNDSGNQLIINLPLLISEAELNNSKMPIFKYNGSRTPYIRWFRDGKSDEIEVKKFYKLAKKLRSSRTLIIDVRGNKNGSFYFIEKWLKEYTKNHWKNVIVKERQTTKILKGLLNRVQWNIFNSTERILIGEDQLEQKRSQLKALLQYFKEKGIDEKWIETKFIFNGKKYAPEWDTKLIVIANHHCGNGCQFLAALTKQIPNGILVGTNTGPFPKSISGPIFQLNNSQIMLSFSHRIHLNHLGEAVSPLGYIPDYWLFPPMGIKDIQRLSSKID